MNLNEYINNGFVFFLNHSGGKDSQASYLFLKNKVPKDQLVVMHASLGKIEWEGTIEHIENTVEHELIIAHAPKTFFDMVNHRKKFPSPSNRQCTSDLKRNPIDREIRRWLDRNGKYKCVSVLGMRAQESSARSKLTPFELDKKNNLIPRQYKNGRKTTGRQWFRWLPIFDWTEKEVFKYIEMNNEKPHWAYEKGMSRLSCSFCIMASKSDLKTAARLRPKLYKYYVEKEKELNFSFMMPRKDKEPVFLEEYTGIKAS